MCLPYTGPMLLCNSLKGNVFVVGTVNNRLIHGFSDVPKIKFSVGKGR